MFSAALQGTPFLDGKVPSRTWWRFFAWIGAELGGLRTTATVDFANTAAGLTDDKTVSVPGAREHDEVTLGWPSVVPAGANFKAFVSAPDVVTIRFYNHIAGASNPNGLVFKVRVRKGQS